MHMVARAGDLARLRLVPAVRKFSPPPNSKGSMPASRRILKVAAALIALVLLAVVGAAAYAMATTDARLQFNDAPAPVLQASTDSAIIAQGRYLVRGPAHCSACHSSGDIDQPAQVVDAPLRGGLPFEMGPLGTRYARNLTPHATSGLGRYSDAQLARTLRTGVTPSGELSFFMRYSASNLSDEDIVAVLSYLRSLEPLDNPVPPGEWSAFGKMLLTYAFPPLAPRASAAPAHVAPAEAPSVARGEYLAEQVMLCTMCHTAMDQSTMEFTGPKAGGSLAEASHGADSDMEFVAPNLTSHPTGITGRMDEAAFVARIRAGRLHASSIMPWENFGITSESDLRSVYQYLRTLPPVDNDVGPTYRRTGWKVGEPVGTR